MASASVGTPGSPQRDEVVTTPSSQAPVGIADPGPLGLAGFAGTTFFLSVVNTNMLGASVQTVVLGLALFYGGIAQLAAGMWEFVKGNTFGALAFASFGAFWLSFWYLLNHLPEKAAPKDVLHGVAVYLLVWTIFTAYMTIAATRVSGAVLVVFSLLTLTFLALTIGWFSESVADFEKNSNAWIHIGGWLGLATAVAAWYASFAGVTNATFRRVVLPTFPR
ncbi:MAG TPA: acetate uptake transporter [Jatrophihabitantaceae bacterium]|nr:acetate uptake transporter [Jatrophihabitantaceae bacterium]